MSRVGDHARELYDDALNWTPDAADMTWTTTPTEEATLVKVEALIARADGREERWALDLEAYRDGRFEPAPTLANGESLAIVTIYA